MGGMSRARGYLKNPQTAQKTEQKILDLMAIQPQITRQEMADQVGISLSGVKYIIRKLSDNGTIRRVGASKNGYWEILAPSAQSDKNSSK